MASALHRTGSAQKEKKIYKHPTGDFRKIEVHDDIGDFMTGVFPVL